METPWSLQGFYGKIGYGDKMKSLYDFTYDQMGDMALEQGWKNFVHIRSFNGCIANVQSA